MQRLDDLFVAPTFIKAWTDRRREDRLLSEVLECIERLGENPDHPGLNTEKLFASRGVDVYSARINIQFRLIFAWLRDGRLILLHFDNHDEAYDRAARLRDEVGRLIERAERWQGRPAPRPTKMPLLDENVPVPVESLLILREMLEDGLHEYIAYLDDFQRNYATVDFTQRNGLMFIRGGAGTGKTAIAIHRAIYLAQQSEMGRRGVLYLCFNRVLSSTVFETIRILSGGSVPSSIQVNTFHSWASQYLASRQINLTIAEDNELAGDVRRIIEAEGLRDQLDGLRVAGVVNEIKTIIKPAALETMESYLAFERRGASVRLREAQRIAIWRAFEGSHYKQSGKIYYDDVAQVAIEALKNDETFEPYRGVIVDEGQDCSPMMARLAMELVRGDHRRLMVLADPTQSIYPNGFQWARREFAPRGAQNIVLRVPYRSTPQVHALASSLFRDSAEAEPEMLELNPGKRHGPLPRIFVESDRRELDRRLVGEIRSELEDTADFQRKPGEIAVLVPSNRTRDRVVETLQAAGLAASVVDRDQPAMSGETIKVATIHSAKGLDFPSVYLYAFVAEGYNERERRPLLYVGLTRSSFRLTVLCDRDSLSPLLFDLDPATYDLDGTARGLLAR